MTTLQAFANRWLFRLNVVTACVVLAVAAWAWPRVALQIAAGLVVWRVVGPHVIAALWPTPDGPNEFDIFD